MLAKNRKLTFNESDVMVCLLQQQFIMLVPTTGIDAYSHFVH